MGVRRTTASRALTVLRALAACCLLASCTGVSGDQGGSGGRGVSGGQSTTASSAGTTVDPYGLLNAEVPALCDHSAGGRLINGSLPDAGAQGGRVSLRKDVLSAVTSASSSDVLAIGTDPSAAIAAAVSCEQQEGAARSERHMSWPDAVVVWDDAFNLVAWVDLSGTEGERGRINAIEISGTDMQIKWTYAGDGDQTTSSGTYSAQGHVDVAEEQGGRAGPGVVPGSGLQGPGAPAVRTAQAAPAAPPGGLAQGELAREGHGRARDDREGDDLAELVVQHLVVVLGRGSPGDGLPAGGDNLVGDNAGGQQDQGRGGRPGEVVLAVGHCGSVLRFVGQRRCARLPASR